MLRRKKATGLDHDRNPVSLSSFLRREVINSELYEFLTTKQIFSAYAENVVKKIFRYFSSDLLHFLWCSPIRSHAHQSLREREKERESEREREREREKKSQGTLEYLVEILCKVSWIVWRSYDLVYLHDLQHQLVISVQDTA